MQWAAADQSIQLSLNQTAQLVCLGAVAAFLNSELVAGKAASGSPLSVGQLSAAMAAANTTKAAEIAKQMAQSQKVCTITLSPPKQLLDAVPQAANVPSTLVSKPVQNSHGCT